MSLTVEDFLATTPGLIAIVDSEYRRHIASPALDQLLGYEREGSKTFSLLSCLSGQSVSVARKALDTAFSQRSSVAGVHIEYGDPARPTHGCLDVWPLNSQTGELFAAVQLTSLEVEGELESRLHELAEQSERILNAAGEGIYGVDPNGCATFVNRAAIELLGWEPGEVLGKRLHDIHHHTRADGTSYPSEQCPIHLSLEDGVAHRVDNEVFWTAAGEAIPVEYVSTPIIQHGLISGAVVVFRDIRERLEATRVREEAFAELESVKRKLELILEGAGEGIYGLDRNGYATFANKAAIDLLGWKLDQVIGSAVHELHHHSHADGTRYPREDCPVYAALKDGEVHRVDNEVFWTRNGAARSVEYTSTPILSDEGQPDGAVVIFRDISERKRIERERDQAFAEVRKLNEQLEQERDYLREEVDLTINFGEIVGESQALRHTLAQINAVAPTPVNVLIFGESGVGKEMIARAIHAASERRDAALVKVNCASIPKELFESEFFGHVKGAFTGAHRDRIGRMQLADGGTLFLDEVGEIPLSLQGKLLRALQENEFERVGDERTVAVDVRIVAATNRDLRAEIKAGRFREDLFYRLSVFPVEVPPLRERKEDIVLLAVHFVERFCKELGRESLAISRQQANLLRSQRWPGNIRELKNVMERAVILSRGKRLSLDFATSESDGGVDVDSLAAPTASFMTEGEFRALERSNLVAALEHAGWRISGAGGAAELLEIKPSTVAYRMKSFGIETKKPKRS